MKTEEDAFMAGLTDGLKAYSDMEKVAEAFQQGLVDGAASVQHTPIMEKIAQLLDSEEVVEEVKTESTADRLRALIRG